MDGQRDKVCSCKKGIFANLLLLFFNGNSILKCVNNNVDKSYSINFYSQALTQAYSLYFCTLVSLPVIAILLTVFIKPEFTISCASCIRRIHCLT